jgi:hypothetical protein
MSTHCGIAIKTENGYNTIYCHHDGYPSYMWPMLTKNYNTEEFATKLVGLGDASSIAEKLEPTPGVAHTFDFPERDVCIFYTRDRGENWDDNAPALFAKQNVLNNFYYAYIWEDGCWHFYDDGKEVYYNEY